MNTSSSTYLEQLCAQLRLQPPFQLLSSEIQDAWFGSSKLIQLRPGQTLISPRQLEDRIYLVIQGQVRLLWQADGEISTLERRGAGQLLGWVSLLRGGSCEWVSAAEPTTVLALSAQIFLKGIACDAAFATWFCSLPQLQETHLVATAALELMPQRFEQWRDRLSAQLKRAVVCAVTPGAAFVPTQAVRPGTTWHLSTSAVNGVPVGTLVQEGQVLPVRLGFQLPYRLIGLPPLDEIVVPSPKQSALLEGVAFLEKGTRGASLHELGILEGDDLEDDVRYPLVRGKGVLDEAMAACEMMALVQRVPFRRDSIKKVLEDQLRRDKSLSLELFGALTESLGLRTQLGSVDNEYFGSVEAPALLMLEGTPVVLFEVKPEAVVIGHPRLGLVRKPLKSFRAQLGENIRFALPRRIGSTPTSRFGWSWFTPMIVKY